MRSLSVMEQKQITGGFYRIWVYDFSGCVIDYVDCGDDYDYAQRVYEDMNSEAMMTGRIPGKPRWM